MYLTKIIISAEVYNNAEKNNPQCLHNLMPFTAVLRVFDQTLIAKEYYKCIHAERLNNEIKKENHINFVACAIKCERKDVFLTKEVLTHHFNRIKLEEKLEKDEIFLSSMKRRAYFRKKKLKKYTEDCKSLFFV